MLNTSSDLRNSLSSDLIEASIILPIMEKYVTMFLYIAGFIGSILNIYIFLQNRFRVKSCSTYFILSSIIDFIFINTFLLIQLISLLNLEIVAYITTTIIWCKFGNYLFFLLPCLSSSYIILASIDRFCSSSFNETLQKLNQLKLSRILALIILLFWLIFSLHIPISYNHIQSTPTSSIKCSPQLNLANIFIFLDGYFFAIFNWVIVPLFLTIFGLLIFRNIKFIHRRTYPQQLSTNRYNQHLITMLLFQVSLTVILNIPYIVLYLYGIYNSAPKQLFPLLMYEIFSYLGSWFWFMNYCKSFYINTLSSKTFRNVLKRKIIYLIQQSKDIILQRTRTIN